VCRLQIEFVWHDSFHGSDKTAQKCLALEESAILFNIASMLTALAADQGRGDEDGLKLSYNYFVQAAAVLSHIQSTLSAQLLLPITADLTTPGITLSHSTCVAQAQECFYERAVKMKTSPKLLYKLAAGALFYYKKMVSSAKAPASASRSLGSADGSECCRSYRDRHGLTGSKEQAACDLAALCHAADALLRFRGNPCPPACTVVGCSLRLRFWRNIYVHATIGGTDMHSWDRPSSSTPELSTKSRRRARRRTPSPKLRSWTRPT
jgi:hypothetical protein